MHRVGRDGLHGLDVRTFGVDENDLAIFVFGEIDIRCHVGKQRDIMKRTSDEIIHTLVRNYLNTILENQKLFAKLHCAIFTVLPPTNRSYNPEFPYYGMLHDRVLLTKAINTLLRAEAQAHGLYLMDVYNDYALPDGSFNPALSDGRVHIDPNKNGPVRKALLEIVQSISNSLSCRKPIQNTE